MRATKKMKLKVLTELKRLCAVGKKVRPQRLFMAVGGDDHQAQLEAQEALTVLIDEGEAEVTPDLQVTIKN